MTTMTAGEFARSSRLSEKALRLYATNGVLPPASVDPVTGIRRYGDAELARARRVTVLRALGLALADVVTVLAADRADALDAVDAAWRRSQGDHVARRVLVLRARELLTGDAPPVTGVLERDVPARLVLTMTRSATLDELPDVLPELTHRLFSHLIEVGAELTGPLFVVFHGHVSEDSDGPLEMCAPIGAPLVPAEGMVVRVEPAHREAYVPLTQEQAAQPQVVAVHDAVATWLHQQGCSLAVAAREVYLPAWGHAAPDEVVAEVAYPMLPRRAADDG